MFTDKEYTIEEQIEIMKDLIAERKQTAKEWNDFNKLDINFYSAILSTLKEAEKREGKCRWAKECSFYGKEIEWIKEGEK